MSDEKHTIRAVLGEPYFSRFWAKVEKTETCWLWHGSTSSCGYGCFTIRSTNYPSIVLSTHRMMYWMTYGRIPEGLEIDHLCRVRHCLNPLHLEAVTSRVNVLRGESSSAKNAAKTHCLRGHAFDNENTYIRHCGHRMCRACARQRKREYSNGPRIYVRQTCCKRGHSLEDAYVYPKTGSRICRECSKMRQRKYDAKRRPRH
jgi:HNH endonuclease